MKNHANLRSLAVYAIHSPMSNSPTADREAVRLLAIELGGVRKAARAIGEQNGWTPEDINRFEDRVCQWSKRDKWFPDKPNQTLVSNVSKGPADIVADELQANGKETKLSLSRYAKAQAQRLASKGKLKDHGAFRNIVTGAGTLHGWTEAQQGQQFTLNVLNINSLNVESD